jgi:early endosome antigen 1
VSLSPPAFDNAPSLLATKKQQKLHHSATTETKNMTSSATTTVNGNTPMIRLDLSRISPQDTDSLHTANSPKNGNNFDMRMSQHPANGATNARAESRLSLDASVLSNNMSLATSQHMRKLTELVTTLQSNLAETQQMRYEQDQNLTSKDNALKQKELEINSMKLELQQYLSRCNQLEAELEKEKKGSSLAKHDLKETILMIEKRESESADKLEEALEKMAFAEAEKVRAQETMSEVERLKHEYQSKSQELEKYAIQLESDRRSREEDRAGFDLQIEGFERRRGELQRREAELDARERQMVQIEASLTQQSQSLAKERLQVQTLQRQLLDTQASRAALEAANEENLLRYAEDLTKRQADLEKKSMEVDQISSKFQKREASLQEMQQQISSKQRRLTGWEERLQAAQDSIESREKELLEKEEQLSQKVHDLVKLEADLGRATQELQGRRQSYEARQSLMEQAMGEMVARRKAEEQKLEKLRTTIEVMETQAQNTRMDSKHLRDQFNNQMTQMQAEHSRIQSEISKAHTELSNVKQQLAQTKEEAKQHRIAVTGETSRLQNTLETMRREVAASETTKKAVEADIQCRREELDRISNQIMKEEKTWKVAIEEFERNQEALVKARRSEAEASIDVRVSNAKQELNSLAERYTEKHTSMAFELDERMQQIERLRANVAKASEDLALEKARLKHDMSDCKVQRERLDRLVACVESAENREKELRENLQREVEWLRLLLETERKDHSAQIKLELRRQLDEHQEESRRSVNEFTIRVESLQAENKKLQVENEKTRAMHAEKLRQVTLEHQSASKEKQSLEERLQSISRQKQSAEKELQSVKREKELLEETVRSVSNDRKSLEKELQSISKEKQSLEAEIGKANERAGRAEKEILHYEQKLLEKGQANEEQQTMKVRQLLQQLDIERSSLQKKQEAVQLQEKLLEEQTSQIRDQFDALKKAGEGFNLRLDDLKAKVISSHVVIFRTCLS